jgi:hypothetical protein
MKMTNTKSHAQREMDVLIETTPDAIIAPFKEEILAICEAFGKSGQSGGSAPYVASALSQAIEKLCLQKAIAPLTGNDDEWVDMSEYYNKGDVLFQNKRDFRVFKDETGKSFFVEAIIFEGDIGGAFNGSAETAGGETIRSGQRIKSFPFTPKTFCVDVIDHRFAEDKVMPDPDGDWWTHTIKDESQLQEVFEYYDKMEAK